MNASQPMTPVEALDKQGWTTEILENDQGAVCLIGACRLADGNTDEEGHVLTDENCGAHGAYERLARKLQRRRHDKHRSRYPLPEDFNDFQGSVGVVRGFLRRVTRLFRWQARAEARKLLTATDVTVDAGNTPALSADLSPVDFLSTVKPTATTTERNAKRS